VSNRAFRKSNEYIEIYKNKFEKKIGVNKKRIYSTFIRIIILSVKEIFFLYENIIYLIN